MTRARGFSSYKTFGIRKGWLEEFFRDPEKWWTENTLGPVQFEAMRKWLSDAEIIDSKRARVTETGEILREIGADDLFTWAVIWTNLAKNSSLISWYVNNLEWGKTYTREELLELMGDNLSLATRKNGLQSLVELFRDTPLGEDLGVGTPEFKGRKCVAIYKKGVDLYPKLEIPVQVIPYSLRVFSEVAGKSEFTLDDLYDSGASVTPYKLFGIPKYALISVLKDLSSKYPKLVSFDSVIIYLNIPKISFILHRIC